MINLPEQDSSYWLESVHATAYPKLSKDIEANVAIIGAGIAGLTAAYMLKRAGRTVVVLEKDTVGSGVTGHTTGKITSQHNLIYAKLTDRVGIEKAKVYGRANQAAIDEIAAIIKAERIDCDWRREDNYVFTTDPSKVSQLQNETLAAEKCGLPATFETTSPLSFPIKGAVRFSDQATFHVRKYLAGLARAVEGDGSHVFEHTHVTRIKEKPTVSLKAAGQTVRAKKVIVATNIPTFPLLARATYAAVEYPMQSYIVAGRLPGKLEGMYISPDDDQYSILPFSTGTDRYLLIGGEGHIFGTRFNKQTRYKRLAEYAHKHFGIADFDYQWTHRDYLGYDDMPVVGSLYPSSRHTYTASAFMKWGLTNGTMAARILTDLICEKDNPWADTFYPHRLKAVASIPKVIGEHLGIK